MKSPLVNGISLLLGILGLFIGYIFYKKGQKEKAPCWAIKTSNLFVGFSNKIHKLNVRYDDIPTETLSISKIIIWNDGKETIDRSDESDINPMMILPANGNVKILDAKILAINSTASKVGLNFDKDKGTLKIDFEYLNYRKGVVIQIVHTGLKSSDIMVTGDFKGVNLIKKKEVFSREISMVPFLRGRDRKFSPVIRGLSNSFFVLFMSVGPFISFRESILKNNSDGFFWIGMLGYSLFIGTLIWGFYKNLTSIVPEGLEIYEDKIMD